MGNTSSHTAAAAGGAPLPPPASAVAGAPPASLSPSSHPLAAPTAAAATDAVVGASALRPTPPSSPPLRAAAPVEDTTPLAPPGENDGGGGGRGGGDGGGDERAGGGESTNVAAAATPGPPLEGMPPPPPARRALSLTHFLSGGAPSPLAVIVPGRATADVALDGDSLEAVWVPAAASTPDTNAAGGGCGGGSGSDRDGGGGVAPVSALGAPDVTDGAYALHFTFHARAAGTISVYDGVREVVGSGAGGSGGATSRPIFTPAVGVDGGGGTNGSAGSAGGGGGGGRGVSASRAGRPSSTAFGPGIGQGYRQKGPRGVRRGRLAALLDAQAAAATAVGAAAGAVPQPVAAPGSSVAAAAAAAGVYPWVVVMTMGAGVAGAAGAAASGGATPAATAGSVPPAPSADVDAAAAPSARTEPPSSATSGGALPRPPPSPRAGPVRSASAFGGTVLRHPPSPRQPPSPRHPPSPRVSPTAPTVVMEEEVDGIASAGVVRRTLSRLVGGGGGGAGGGGGGGVGGGGGGGGSGGNGRSTSLPPVRCLVTYARLTPASVAAVEGWARSGSGGGGGGTPPPARLPLEVIEQRVHVGRTVYALSHLYGADEGGRGGGGAGVIGGGVSGAGAGDGIGGGRGSGVGVAADSAGVDECVVCLTHGRAVAVMPCRHLCLCGECADDFFEQPNCPVCRQRIGSLLQNLPAMIRVQVRFAGGLELLVGGRKRIEVELPPPPRPPPPPVASSGGGGSEDGPSLSPSSPRTLLSPTVGDLITHVRASVLTERHDAFSTTSDGGVRPGILVLINDVDWELEGTSAARLAEGDVVSFISTLHGG